MYFENQICYERNIVDANEYRVLFYTYPEFKFGIEDLYTTLWEYDIVKKELRECFTFFGSKITIWADLVNNEYLYINSKEQNSDEKFIGKLLYNGTGLWEYRIKQPYNIEQPVMDKNGNVYAALEFKWIYCFDRKGNIAWKWTPEEKYSENNNITRGILIPKIIGNDLYIITLIGLFSLSEKGVTKKYIKPVCNNIIGCSIIDDIIIFRDLINKRLACYDNDGKYLWDFNTDYYGKPSDIATDGKGNIYFTTHKLIQTIKDGKHTTKDLCHLISLDYFGKEQWVKEVDVSCKEVAPLITEQIIVMGIEGINVYSFTGEIKKQCTIKGTYCGLTVIDEIVIVLLYVRGRLYLAELLENGEIIRKFEILKKVDKEKEEITDGEWDSSKHDLIAYIERNIDTWCKYHGNGSLKEIKILYEVYKNINIEVCIDECWYLIDNNYNNWNDIITEEMKEECKECGYLRDIWGEFCIESDSEKLVNRMINEICEELGNNYQLNITLAERYE